MKPEPLTKEKIIELNSEESIVYIDELKSAVEWLLKEIEKEKEFYYDYQEEQVALLNWVEKLIKKAFSGVIEE